MPTYTFSFPASASGKAFTVRTSAGVTVDTIAAGATSGAVSSVAGSTVQGPVVVTSVLDVGAYEAEAVDARLFYSARAVGVLDVPASLSELPETFAGRLPSVGERLRRAAAGALGTNSIELGPLAKPPVITTGSATLNAAKSALFRMSVYPTKYLVTGGIAQVYASVYYGAYTVTLASGGNFPGDGTKQANQWSVEFWCDDPSPQIKLFGANPLHIEVDGQPVAGDRITPAGGTPNYVMVNNSVGSATITASGGVFTTPTAHGLAVGDQVELGAITTTTGVSANTAYWVLATPSATTFTLTTTPAGSALTLTGDGSTTSVSLSKARHYRVELNQASAFEGLLLGGLYSVWAPKSGTDLRVVTVGDSIDASTGTLMPNGSWQKVAGKLLGWTDVRQVSLGGTGFINPGTYSNTFGSASRVANVVAHDPDVLVITLTQNDDAYTGAQITAAALATFQAYRVALPDVPIIVTGADAASSGPSAARIATDTAGKAAFTAWADDNAWFIENVNDPAGSWFTGTGRTSAKSGSGNRDRYGSDGAHPNTEGHKLIGRRWAQEFRAMVLPNLA